MENEPWGQLGVVSDSMEKHVHVAEDVSNYGCRFQLFLGFRKA